MKKPILRLTAMLVAALCLLPTAVSAESLSVNPERVAALLRNDLGLWAGCLAVRETVFSRMSTSEEHAGRQFITILNANPGCYAVTEEGRLTFNTDAIGAVPSCESWSAADVLLAKAIASHLQGARVAGGLGDVSAKAVWYEYQLLSTSYWNDNHNYRDTDRARHPLTVSVSTTVTYQATVSGGANVPLDVLLAWLKLEFVGTWTRGADYAYTPKGPGDPNSRFYPRGEEAEIWHTDYHQHSSASYYLWYCTDEDVKGEVTRWFMGTYTATGYKFDYRTYWPQLYACYCDLCNQEAE